LKDDLFTVRPVRPSDYPYIVTLLGDEGMTLPSDWREGTAAVNDADELVGYIHVRQTDQGPHVAPVAVFPAWRGRGVGRTLIDLELARSGKLKLAARGSSAGFYRALGFSEITFDEISDELEEDCKSCDVRVSCAPVAFMRRSETEEEAETTLTVLAREVVARQRAAALRCADCGVCRSRCELLETQGWSLPSILSTGISYLEHAIASTDVSTDLRAAMDADTSFYRFFRTCCACGRCTAICPEGLDMAAIWRDWRHLFAGVGLLREEDVRMVAVDGAWDLFRVYRAVYGVDYADLPQLTLDTTVGSDSAETLFFPGCTLVSYVPELTRAAFSWLRERGDCLLATQCCGSPLVSAGQLDRADKWKRRLLEAAHARGVRRIVTVCPGCAGELARVASQITPDIDFVALPALMAEEGMRADISMLGPRMLPLCVIDACHDRAAAHGDAIRVLLDGLATVASGCEGCDAFCCGAGGSVGSFDPMLTRTRTCASWERARAVGAASLVVSCPTCAYTYAHERWVSLAEGADPAVLPIAFEYLELMFGQFIDWDTIFSNLENMWTGEYAAWVAQQLL
jgi:fumarate reductase (CoM/CoB) subunit B